MRKAVLAAAVLLGCTATGAIARDRAAPPVAEATGKPVDCVNITSIRNTRVYGDSTIDFHMAGGQVLRNTLPYSCPSLGFEERFLYKTSLSQLCSVDIITVLQSPGLTPGASCGLGKFQPVKLAKAPTR